MPTEEGYTAYSAADANPLVFSPTDFAQTELAWNWYKCGVKENSYPWLILMTVLEMNNRNGVKLPSSSVNPDMAKQPDWKYFERLMKVIPYGLADGSLSTSFPDSGEMICWLMRAVAIEEQAIKFGITLQDFDAYLQDSKVQREGTDYAREIFEIYKSGNKSRARDLIRQGKDGLLSANKYYDVSQRESVTSSLTNRSWMYNTSSSNTSSSTTTTVIPFTDKKKEMKTAALNVSRFAGNAFEQMGVGMKLLTVAGVLGVITLGISSMTELSKTKKRRRR